MSDLRTLTFAVDFDGTCVDHRFPDVGPDVPGAVETLRALTERGHRIILWTMRSAGQDSGDPLADAVEWFRVRGIPLFGVNGNPEQGSWTQSPKAYAQVYIDDAALGAPLRAFGAFRKKAVDWSIVARRLRGMGALPRLPRGDNLMRRDDVPELAG